MLIMKETRDGRTTPELEAVAREEGIDVALLAERVANGHVAIMKNSNNSHRPVGVGKGLRTKVNANLGTSSDASDIEEELLKVDAASALRGTLRKFEERFAYIERHAAEQGRSLDDMTLREMDDLWEQAKHDAGCAGLVRDATR